MIAVPAVLVYLFHKNEVLMLHRATRPDDIHSGKYNGLGGKLEAGESPGQAAVREVFEESGIRLLEASLKPLGVLQFPNFKPKKGEDWTVWVFRAELSDRALPEHSSDEGALEWVPADRVTALNLWEGDRFFIPYVLQSQPMQGTLWYVDGRLDRHEIQTL